METLGKDLLVPSSKLGFTESSFLEVHLACGLVSFRCLTYTISLVQNRGSQESAPRVS